MGISVPLTMYRYMYLFKKNIFSKQKENHAWLDAKLNTNYHI